MSKSWFTCKVIEDAAVPVAKAGGNGGRKGRVAEMAIHGPIADSDFWGEKVAKASDFIASLNGAGEVDLIRLSIQSPGGMVTEGWAIYNALKLHPARVEARVEGLAASMASVIAMAADQVEMPRNAYLMIHDVRCGAYGTAREVENMAATMKKLNDDIVATYATRTGLSEDEVRDLMAAETYMNGEEAREKGFADIVLDGVQARAIAPSHLKCLGPVAVPVQLALNVRAEAEAGEGDDEPGEETTLSDEQGGGAGAADEADGAAGDAVDETGAADAESSGDQDPAAAAAVDPETNAEASAKPTGLRAIAAKLKAALTGEPKPETVPGPTSEPVDTVSRLEFDGVCAQVALLSGEQAALTDRLRNALTDHLKPDGLTVPEGAGLKDLVDLALKELKLAHVIAAEIAEQHLGLSWEESEKLPAPVDAKAMAERDTEAEIESLREELKNCDDRKRKAEITARLRELRGSKAG